MNKLFCDKYRVKLGFLPTRRILNRPNLFNRDFAIAEKDKIERWMDARKIDYVNLNFLNEEGLIYTDTDVEKVVEKFRSEKVNAIFAPHCNFGTENAVAKVAKQLGLPLLIWGPRDEAPLPGVSRPRDSQCGLFATSRVLQTFGVPYSYITNSSIEDPVFEKGFFNFIAAAAVVKMLRGMRIGQVGVRPASFWSVKSNEEELLERFGVEVVPITVQDVKRMMDAVMAQKPECIEAEKLYIRGRMDKVSIDDTALTRVAAMKLALSDWAVAENIVSAAVFCGGGIRELTGIMPCFVLSELTDEGFPAICETDLHGCISAVITQAASMCSSATFLADMTIRHPTNDNAELMWHCGVFPRSLRREGTPAELNNHYGSGLPGAAQWEIKGGGMTIVRFDGTTNNYRLLVTRGKGVDGPTTNGTYVWVEFKDWPELEHRFIYGPYIHHCVGVHADIAPVFLEAARFIPGLKLDMVDPTEAEAAQYLR